MPHSSHHLYFTSKEDTDMLQSFIALPSVYPARGVDFEGQTFEPATDNAFRVEYVTRGRILRGVRLVKFYKAHTYDVRKMRNYEIVFASNNLALGSGNELFNPSNAGDALIPIYVRDRSARNDVDYKYGIPCAVHVPNVNFVLEHLFGQQGNVMSLAQVVRFMIQRSYNVNLAAIPYNMLEGDVDVDWATLQPVRDDLISETQDSDSERLARTMQNGCVLRTQFPIEIKLLFENVRSVHDVAKLMTPNFNASIPNVLNESAKGHQYIAECNMTNGAAFNELGDPVIVYSTNKFHDIPYLLSLHASMSTSEFTMTPPDWSIGGQAISGADPLLNMMPMELSCEDIASMNAMMTVLVNNSNVPAGYEHIFGGIVSTYSENIFICHRDDPDCIISYFDLPLWILASGGGLINSETIHGLE